MRTLLFVSSQRWHGLSAPLAAGVASLRERGVEVARLAGLATADEATAGGAESIAASLGSAVAVLYQRIARELLVRRAALASPQEL